MKQSLEDDSNGDDGNGRRMESDGVTGLPRVLSQRLMLGEGGDRKTLLKFPDSKPDSKRSLLTKSLSRSMVKLKNTVKQMGDNDTTEQEDDEQVVPLMEFEMLKARLHVSEGTVLQQKEQIEQLHMQLGEKDDVIDVLMQKIEQMSSGKSASQPAPQRLKEKRMSSLEEKRLKKRQMERAHSLGFSRTQIGLHTLDSVLNGGSSEEIGNPSTASADPQPNQGPISGPTVRKPSLTDMAESTQENGPLADQDRARSPHSRRHLLAKQLSSRRNNTGRRKTPNDDVSNVSEQPTSTPSQPNAADETTDKSPHRRQLTKQSSRRSNNGRKNSMDNSFATSGNDSQDLSGTPRQPDMQVLTSSAAASEDTDEGKRTTSKSPLRRQFPKQTSKRNFRQTSEDSNAESSSGVTQEQNLTTRDSSDSPYSRRKKNVVLKQSSRGPSRRRSDDSAPEAIRDYRNKGQSRSAKAREDMKQNSNYDSNDLEAPPLAFFSSSRGPPRRGRRADRNESSNDAGNDTSTSQRMPNTTLVFPASTDKDFNDQHFADIAGKFSDLKEDEPETDGFLVTFGDSPFEKMEAKNDDDHLNGETTTESEVEEIDKASAKQDPLLNAPMATEDIEKTNSDPNDLTSFYNADSNIFSTNFSMMSLNLEEIAENDEKSSTDPSSSGHKPTQSMMTADESKPPAIMPTVSIETEAPDNDDQPEGVAAPSEDEIVASSQSIALSTESLTSFISPVPTQSNKKVTSPGRDYLLKMNRNETLLGDTLGDERTKSTSSGRGRDYLLKMNRNETITDTVGGESTRSRSLSPGWTSPRTPSGKRKLRIRKESKNRESKNTEPNSGNEPNLNKDQLKAKFKNTVRKIVKLNDQFQHEALSTIEKEKQADIRSISISGSISNLDDILPLVDESKTEELRRPSISEDGRIILPPPPPISAMSPPLSMGGRKKNKAVHWELDQNLFRLLVIPVYDKQQKRDCFYNDEDIKKFRFDLVSHIFGVFTIYKNRTLTSPVVHGAACGRCGHRFSWR